MLILNITKCISNACEPQAQVTDCHECSVSDRLFPSWLCVMSLRAATSNMAIRDCKSSTHLLLKH